MAIGLSCKIAAEETRRIGAGENRASIFARTGREA